MRISLYGHDQESYYRVTKNKKAFDIVVKNLKEFCKYVPTTKSKIWNEIAPPPLTTRPRAHTLSTSSPEICLGIWHDTMLMVYFAVQQVSKVFLPHRFQYPLSLREAIRCLWPRILLI